jgi:heme exporter protein CcmD
MGSIGQYLSMGGYGRFIWTAYGAAAVLIALLVLDTLGRRRRRLAELARLESGDRR